MTTNGSSSIARSASACAAVASDGEPVASIVTRRTVRPYSLGEVGEHVDVVDLVVVHRVRVGVGAGVLDQRRCQGIGLTLVVDDDDLVGGDAACGRAAVVGALFPRLDARVRVVHRHHQPAGLEVAGVGPRDVALGAEFDGLLERERLVAARRPRPRRRSCRTTPRCRSRRHRHRRRRRRPRSTKMRIPAITTTMRAIGP